MGRRAARWLANLLVLFAFSSVLAGEPEKSKPGSGAKLPEKPTERFDAWADHIIYQGDSGKFHLSRQVTVIRGDLRVDCEEMEGIVDPKTKQVSRVVATGSVQLLTVAAVNADPNGRPTTSKPTDDAWRASCGKADYDLQQDRIEMTGLPGKPRPRLWRDRGNAEADTIIFFPNKGEYELIGDPVIRGEIPTGPAQSSEPAPAPKAEQ